MTEELENPQLFGHVAVIELEPGQVLFDPVVPAGLPILNQGGYGGSGEGLAVGGNGKEGVGINRIVASQLSRAVATRQHQLAILDDGNSQARHPPFITRPGDVGRQLLYIDIR